MYCFLQLQGTVYTTPVLFIRESTSFTVLSCLLSVDVVVNTVLMSYLLHTLLKSSLIPDTYGRQRYTYRAFFFLSLLQRSYCSSDGVFRVPIGLEDFSHMPLPFPDFSPYSYMCIVLAQLHRHEATPVLICCGWWEVYCRYRSVWVDFCSLTETSKGHTAEYMWYQLAYWPGRKP